MFLEKMVNDECAAAGNCSSCSTFNDADAAHIIAMGWNSIRLGVVWAGAQPRDEDALDPTFLSMLHDVLDVCDRSGGILSQVSRFLKKFVKSSKYLNKGTQ